MPNLLNKFYTEKNRVIEISFSSSKKYRDPFNEVDLEVELIGPDSRIVRVPAFWAGGNSWKVRLSSNIMGKHGFNTSCSDNGDSGLHNKKGTIIVTNYKGSNRLYKSGPVRLSKDNRHLEHEDGTPFFWLADTWWYAFFRRFRYPEIIRTLAQDRINKGFSVIYMIAGLYPDYGKEFEFFSVSEAGQAWDKEYRSINPYFFDMADIKVFYLIEKGLLPCIFGMWGFYLPWMSLDKVKKHWRYIISRWGAYPVAWSAAGEATMPSYSNDFFSGRDEEVETQRKGWSEVLEYIKSTDPFKRIMTIHPSPFNGSYATRESFDLSLFDIDMLNIGHRGQDDLDLTMEKLQKTLNSRPVKPVIQGEVNYEGHSGSSWSEIQRFLFWTHMLSGAAGYSYGATGIWDMKTDKFARQPGSCGTVANYTWEEGMDFKGSYHLGLGKRFLEKFDYHKIEPCPLDVSPHWTDANRRLPYAAKIGDDIRIIYFPAWFLIKDMFLYHKIKISGLKKVSEYLRYFFDPRTGRKVEKKYISSDRSGTYNLNEGWLTSLPTYEDWVLVLMKK